MKLLGKELNVPMMVLSQWSRGGSGRASSAVVEHCAVGVVEQDADVVGFIFREEVSIANADLRGLAELIVAKQRNTPWGR
jgi:replicative DNA helicase